MEDNLKHINDWLNECGVSGTKDYHKETNFEFFDSDIDDLKNAVRREIKQSSQNHISIIKQEIENAKKGCGKELDNNSKDRIVNELRDLPYQEDWNTCNKKHICFNCQANLTLLNTILNKFEETKR